MLNVGMNLLFAKFFSEDLASKILTKPLFEQVQHDMMI